MDHGYYRERLTARFLVVAPLRGPSATGVANSRLAVSGAGAELCRRNGAEFIVPSWGGDGMPPRWNESTSARSYRPRLPDWTLRQPQDCQGTRHRLV